MILITNLVTLVTCVTLVTWTTKRIFEYVLMLIYTTVVNINIKDIIRSNYVMVTLTYPYPYTNVTNVTTVTFWRSLNDI